MTTEVEEALFDREEIECAMVVAGGRLKTGYTIDLTMGPQHGNRPPRIEVRIVDHDDPAHPRLLEDFGLDEEDSLKSYLLGIAVGALYGRH
jgi:hypothetical protein